jgi:hypothetical protein
VRAKKAPTACQCHVCSREAPFHATREASAHHFSGTHVDGKSSGPIRWLSQSINGTSNQRPGMAAHSTSLTGVSLRHYVSDTVRRQAADGKQVVGRDTVTRFAV